MQKLLTRSLECVRSFFEPVFKEVGLIPKQEHMFDKMVELW